MLDLATLSAPLPGADPAGADLAYDPGLLALEEALANASENGPDWRELRKQALALLERGRHLRVMVYLALAELGCAGLPGLADGLRLLAMQVEGGWQTVQPRLDPDDGNDPTERVNILAALSPPAAVYQDPFQFPQRLQRTPFVTSRRLGALDLRTVQLAAGELQPAEGESRPAATLVKGILADAPSEERERSLAAVRSARESLAAIQAAVAAAAGPGRGLDLSRLDGLLHRIGDVLDSAGVAVPAAASPGQTGAPEAATATAGMVMGEIASRQQALDAIERVIRYYETNEPGHPAPLLLRRARRLASASFAELLRDLVPESVDKAGVIFGPDAFAGEAKPT
jgi:type VI secretion system protein ImpA